MRETIERIWTAPSARSSPIQAYYCVGGRRAYNRRPDWTRDAVPVPNWYHFHWLCGDQPSAQLIHCLDKASWALRDAPPQKAWGMGGRQVCIEPKYGDLFDHHAVVYEYANGVRLFGFCRDQPNCYGEYSVVFLGTKGRAFVPNRCRIEGPGEWKHPGGGNNMYDEEHRVLFDAVRKGTPVNNGSYMATSSMLAILARMVSGTGQEITWDQAMQSKQDLRLPRYGWDVVPPIVPDKNGQYPTAMPGMTKLI